MSALSCRVTTAYADPGGYTLSEEREIEQRIAERAFDIAQDIQRSPEKFGELLTDRIADLITSDEHLRRLQGEAAGGWPLDAPAKKRLAAHHVAKGLLSALMDGDSIEFARLFNREIDALAKRDAEHEMESA